MFVITIQSHSGGLRSDRPTAEKACLSPSVAATNITTPWSFFSVKLSACNFCALNSGGCRGGRFDLPMVLFAAEEAGRQLNL
jgi:hypothetical protein